MTRRVHCKFNSITVNFDRTQHGIYLIQTDTECHYIHANEKGMGCFANVGDLQLCGRRNKTLRPREVSQQLGHDKCQTF